MFFVSETGRTVGCVCEREGQQCVARWIMLLLGKSPEEQVGKSKPEVCVSEGVSVRACERVSESVGVRA